LFIAPSLFGVIMFLIIPVIMAAAISFTKWDLLSSPTFTGLANYTKLFDDPRSLMAFVRSGEFVLLSVPLQTALALVVALVIRRDFRGRTLFRAIYVLPWLATPVALAVIWRWLLDPTTGPLGQFLGLFGITSGSWFQDPTLALPAIVLITVWQWVGYNCLFFLAGLQSIPEHINESAILDGASPWQLFWHITLPLLQPATMFVVITNVIGGFQAFDYVYVLTGGGPNRATEVVNYRIYDLAFNQFNGGYASAVAMVLFLVILIATVIQFRYFRSRTVYDLS
jgi:multiple sugar transport system permease protein/sn-glycerol 3-phosphate transport system permease protein